MHGVETAQSSAAALVTQARSSRALRVLAGVALMCVASQVRFPIPFTEVPMTLQSFGALLCGYFLSPAAAVFAILGYLALGAAGLPLFAGSAGLFGSTGGYLVGFAVCAGLVSSLKGGSAASVARLTFAGLAGSAGLFACGFVGQAVFKGSLQVAFLEGVAPFCAKACVQLALAVTLVRMVAKRWRVSEKDN